MTVRKGTYAILMALGSDSVLDVGALGSILFPSGRYCYVGSAMGGLDQRISRHLSREKRARWHIDVLTLAADSAEAYESYPDPVPECELARMAEESGMEPFAPGFGCSDCRCRTHLFRADDGSLKRFLSISGCRPFQGRPPARPMLEAAYRCIRPSIHGRSHPPALMPREPSSANLSTLAFRLA